MSTRSKTRKTSEIPSSGIAEQPQSIALTAVTETVTPPATTAEVRADINANQNANNLPKASITPNSFQQNGAQPDTSSPSQHVQYGYPPWFQQPPNLMMPTMPATYNQDILQKQMSDAVQKAIKEQFSAHQQLNKKKEDSELIQAKKEPESHENVPNKLPTKSSFQRNLRI